MPVKKKLAPKNPKKKELDSKNVEFIEKQRIAKKKAMKRKNEILNSSSES